MRLRSAQFLPKLGFLFFYTSLVVSPLSAARIISLLPSNTEILEALGAGGEVVGITRFDRPAPGREVVGDFFQPNVEKIVSLKPDLILSGLWASSRTGSSLGKMGYAIVEIRNPRSIEEIYESIRSIARTVYRQREAEEVIRDMKSRLA